MDNSLTKGQTYPRPARNSCIPPVGTPQRDAKMTKLWAICRNTFVETIRQPIYGVLIFVTIVILVLSLPLSHWSMETDYEAADQKMLQNLGLSTLLVSGLLIGAFSASGALSREIEDGTALTVISKPLSRATFVFGKFAGLTGALGVALYISALVFLMTVRHHVVSAASSPIDWPVIVLGCSAFGLSILVGALGNLWFSWPFISAQVWSAVVFLSMAMGLIAFIGKGWTIIPFGEGINGQLLIAMSLIFMAVLILTAVAVAASTRLGPAMTLIVCIGVFAVGSSHPFLFARWADRIPLARVLGWEAPDLTSFYQIDALTRDKPIPLYFVRLAAAYCLLCVAGILAVGAGLFQTRQLESQEASAALPGLVGLLSWTGRIAALAAGMAALVIVTTPQFYSVRGFVVAGVLAADAGLGWFIWGRFGRGARWTYYLVLVVAAFYLLGNLALLGVPKVMAWLDYGQGRLANIVTAIVSAAVLAILFLPATRRHFRSR